MRSSSRLPLDQLGASYMEAMEQDYKNYITRLGGRNVSETVSDAIGFILKRINSVKAEFSLTRPKDAQSEFCLINSLSILRYQAAVHEKNKEYLDAIRCLTQGIAAEEKTSSHFLPQGRACAYYHLAFLYVKVKNFTKAHENILMAIELDVEGKANLDYRDVAVTLRDCDATLNGIEANSLVKAIIDNDGKMPDKGIYHYEGSDTYLERVKRFSHWIAACPYEAQHYFERASAWLDKADAEFDTPEKGVNFVQYVPNILHDLKVAEWLCNTGVDTNHAFFNTGSQYAALRRFYLTKTVLGLDSKDECMRLCIIYHNKFVECFKGKSAKSKLAKNVEDAAFGKTLQQYGDDYFGDGMFKEAECFYLASKEVYPNREISEKINKLQQKKSNPSKEKKDSSHAAINLHKKRNDPCDQGDVTKVEQNKSIIKGCASNTEAKHGHTSKSALPKRTLVMHTPTNDEVVQSVMQNLIRRVESKAEAEAEAEKQKQKQEFERQLAEEREAKKENDEKARRDENERLRNRRKQKRNTFAAAKGSKIEGSQKKGEEKTGGEVKEVDYFQMLKIFSQQSRGQVKPSSGAGKKFKIKNKQVSTKPIDPIILRMLSCDVEGSKVVLSLFERQCMQAIESFPGHTGVIALCGSQARDRVLEGELLLAPAALDIRAADYDFQTGCPVEKIGPAMRAQFGDTVISCEVSQYGNDLVHLVIKEDGARKQVDIRYNKHLMKPAPNYLLVGNECDTTISALMVTADGVQHDGPGQGLQDLKEGIIRTVLQPAVSFNQDPIRILRIIKQLTQLSHQSIVTKIGKQFKLADELPKAMVDHAELLLGNPEHTNSWLKKLFFHANHELSIHFMLSLGVFGKLFKEFLPLFQNKNFDKEFCGYIRAIKNKNTSLSMIYDYLLMQLFKLQPTTNLNAIVEGNQLLNRHYSFMADFSKDPVRILREIYRAVSFQLPPQECILIGMYRHANLLRNPEASAGVSYWLQKLFAHGDKQVVMRYLNVSGVGRFMAPRAIYSAPPMPVTHVTNPNALFARQQQLSRPQQSTAPNCPGSTYI